MRSINRLRSTPRDCEWTGLGQLAIGGAIVLALGAVVLGVAVYISASRTAALRHSMLVSGRVASGIVVQTYRTGGDDKKDVFIYDFSAAGRACRGRTETALRRSPHYSIGTSVSVRYLPSHPEQNWIDGYPPRGVPLFLIPLLSGACLVSAWLIVATLRRQRDLQCEGRPALATVKRLNRVSSENRVAQRAFIEFSLLSGSVREGHVDFQRRPPALGSKITILYDPDNPRRIMRYPASLVRVARPAS